MTTAAMLWGLLFSSIGVGYAIYGRKQNVPVAFICGLLLMGYPFVITNSALLVLVGALLMATPFVIKF